MRKLALFLGIFCLATTAKGQCTGASPAWNCTLTGTGSTDAKNLNKVIKRASNGDTINVTGTTTINASTITVAGKYLTLNGQGTTTITFTGGGGFSITATTTGNALLTGFQILGSGIPGTNNPPIQTSTTLSPLTKPFRIYNNTFDDNSPANGAVIIKNTGIGPGLIDHNTFNTHTCNDETIWNWGSGTPLDRSTWTTDVTPGGPNALYIETNTFNHIISPVTGSSCDTSANSNYYGARTVFRYNQLNNGYYIDAHMGNNTTGTGARWVEIYNNTFALPGTSAGYAYHQGSYWHIRGGSGVFFNNTSTGAPYQNVPPGWSFGQLSGSSDQQTGTWPLNWQIGRGINETYSPPYAWGNTVLTNTTTNATSFPSYVQVGTGTASAGCVKTGSTGHPANFCDGLNVGTNSQPSMIKCESAADQTAGCPVAYTYTPYTYPHPLTRPPQ